jgi:hypothetical protein
VGEYIKDIESAAFKNCSNLSSIQLPDSITHIGLAAFSGT